MYIFYGKPGMRADEISKLYNGDLYTCCMLNLLVGLGVMSIRHYPYHQERLEYVKRVDKR